MKQRVRRVFFVVAIAAMLAVIVVPDWCDGLPEWLASLLGCHCSTGNCSGASENRLPKYEPGGGRGNLQLAKR